MELDLWGWTGIWKGWEAWRHFWVELQILVSLRVQYITPIFWFTQIHLRLQGNLEMKRRVRHFWVELQILVSLRVQYITPIFWFTQIHLRLQGNLEMKRRVRLKYFFVSKLRLLQILFGCLFHKRLKPRTDCFLECFNSNSFRQLTTFPLYPTGCEGKLQLVGWGRRQKTTFGNWSSLKPALLRGLWWIIMFPTKI